MTKLVCRQLRVMLQSERDSLLAHTLGQLYPSIGEMTARLGATRFTLVGGQSVASTIGGDPDFEMNISNLLAKRICES